MIPNGSALARCLPDAEPRPPVELHGPVVGFRVQPGKVQTLRYGQQQIPGMSFLPLIRPRADVQNLGALPFDP